MGQTDLDRVKMTQSEASETLSVSCSTVQICSICSMFNFVQFVQCSNLFNLFNVQICSIFQCSNLFNFSMFNFPMVTDRCRCELSRSARPPQPRPWLQPQSQPQTQSGHVLACNVHTPHAATLLGGKPPKKSSNRPFFKRLYNAAPIIGSRSLKS